MTSRSLMMVVLLSILIAGAAQADSLNHLFFGDQRPDPIGPLMQPANPELLSRIRALPQPELIGAPTSGWRIVEKTPLTLRLVWRNASGQKVNQPIKGKLIVFTENTNAGVNFAGDAIQLIPRRMGVSTWVTAIFESEGDVQLAWSYSFLASWPMAHRDFDRLMRSMRNGQGQSQGQSTNSNQSNHTNNMPNETPIGITNDNPAASANN